MPEAFRLGDVGGFECNRVDAVLGGNFPGDLFGGAVIRVGIVVQRIVQIEQDDVDAAHGMKRVRPRAQRRTGSR